MQKSKFTLTFENKPNTVYFYPNDADSVIDGATKERIQTKIKDPNNPKALIDGPTAEWSIPNEPYVVKNIYRLCEHPRLKFLLKKRKDFITIFLSSKSKESMETLQNFMKNMVGVLTQILGHAHELYFLDSENEAEKYTRSKYSFYECIDKAVDFGVRLFEAKNIVLDSKDPYAISGALLDFERTEKIRSTKKTLGQGDEAVMKKTKKKK